jgi:hypothetical protein
MAQIFVIENRLRVLLQFGESVTPVVVYLEKSTNIFVVGI